MQTIGTLIDALCTLNQKLFLCMEDLYAVRRMTFEEFKNVHGSEEGLMKLYDIFKKTCDLNLDRNQLMDEVDITLVDMMKTAQAGGDLDKFVQRKHKTY